MRERLGTVCELLGTKRKGMRGLLKTLASAGCEREGLRTAGRSVCVEGECVRKRRGGVCGAFTAVATCGKWCTSDSENAASKILLMASR